MEIGSALIGRCSKGNQKMYQLWFACADSDGDGRLTGNDAQKFFSMSNLTRQDLKQGSTQSSPFRGKKSGETLVMAAIPGNNGVRVRGPRVVLRARRTWNAEEDDVLLASLKELVVTGWKSGNSFRAGYIYKLEEMMRVRFPRTDIRANPHILSKLTGWKKNYGSLVYILSRSGVGFNLHGDFMVNCEAEQWTQICNVDSNAKNIRGKAWPYYDRWTEVFRKDRATGTNAEDILDAVNDLLIDDNLNADDIYREGVAVDPVVPLNPTDTDDSEAYSNRHDAGTSKPTRKRKQAESIDKTLCELLTQMQRDTNTRLESISHRIGYQSDLGQARKDIWAMLDSIEELSMDERFRRC